MNETAVPKMPESQNQKSEPCSTCCALLEIGGLFCSQCRASKFSQFLSSVVEAEEIKLSPPSSN